MKRIRWNKEKALNSAKNYSSISQYQKKCKGGYNFLYKHELLDELYKIITPRCKPNGHFTERKIRELAAQYKHQSKFKKENPSAYRVAVRKKIASKLFFEKKKRENKYTEEYIKSIALKYNSRKKFMENERGCYDAARRNNILIEVTQHMKRYYGLAKRSVYVFEFCDGSAYIGLSFDPKKREKAHLTRNKKIKEKAAKFDYKLKIIHKNLEAEKAAEMEIEEIKKYRLLGWNVLNKKCGGDLGSRIKK